MFGERASNHPRRQSQLLRTNCSLGSEHRLLPSSIISCRFNTSVRFTAVASNLGTRSLTAAPTASGPSVHQAFGITVRLTGLCPLPSCLLDCNLCLWATLLLFEHRLATEIVGFVGGTCRLLHRQPVISDCGEELWNCQCEPQHTSANICRLEIETSTCV